MALCRSQPRWSSLRIKSLLGATLCCCLGWSHASAEITVYLSDLPPDVPIRHQQQWGVFGCDRAAAATDGNGAPLRIGERTFQRGLGHHANGEITVDLDGQYSRFLTTIGVQWQGGGKGSVIFRIEVDGKPALTSKRISDSDAAQEVDIPLSGAKQLKLIAHDGGDGIACDMANWAEARLIRQQGAPYFGPLTFTLNGDRAPELSDSHCGLSLITAESGPQIFLRQPLQDFAANVLPGESALAAITLDQAGEVTAVLARATIIGPGRANVAMTFGDQTTERTLSDGASIELIVPARQLDGHRTIQLITRGVEGESRVDWSGIRYRVGENLHAIPLRLAHGEPQFPPHRLPPLRPSMEQVLIEWDWRMQDGIETPRNPATWSAATATLLECGDRLIADLGRVGSVPVELTDTWERLRGQRDVLAQSGSDDSAKWEPVWRQLHIIRRRIALSNPLADIGPILFAKRVPSCFSHQLTQYYGMCARPGGAIFALERPGQSMTVRQLTQLPAGSHQHPEVSYDGRRVLFSYCQVDSSPVNRTVHQDRHYHLFQVNVDGSGLRQLTDGDYDDFAPRYLPDDSLLFISTRRGGYHRCGAGPCPVYTLATAKADGSNPHPISYHETHEWDPAILNDGRIIYTRWDYVDRHAVYYEQLWTCRPDGSNVAAYYGNNTFNPVGVWEARPIPGSDLVMATAGAHHAMTAGSIILLDVARGVDGPAPITRLTPDALFPESEAPLQHFSAGAGISGKIDVPAEAARWTGHCYRSPWPLSDSYFLAAYSFEALQGEPLANNASMFGLYLVDRFGNKELLYRDLNISSLWPVPLRPRERPPMLPAIRPVSDSDEGTFFVQNVYDSWPHLPTRQRDRIHQLRVLQVLPKTTPHANSPRVGLANASPGKQVLGTVPVEADGSAYFRAPAKVPLAFQALDASGMAVQTMRSLTYLQPGEQTSCIGCHDHRATTPELYDAAHALRRPPSPIKPGPDGSRPLSYPILVQGVLDKHCIRCHNPQQPDGGIVLTGEPQGEFSASYNALAPLVAFSQWKGTPADNDEPTTRPNRFGARASKLMQLILNGHEGVALDSDDMERLITWMDANALFYGTFDPQDQRRQLRGERIAGPALE